MFVHYRIFCTHKISQEMSIYKYVQSHIIINQQDAVAPVTITRVSLRKNTFNIPITAGNCVIKALHVTFSFL